ncbi:uncharacterized protein LOC129752065 [Uranotaenia lowii]|uniref:uncharacterized protein LOC129752065 n=1 Tax=Uranotaenia lowii TaxID=190385 RepID=UPI00247921AB|nr:uncharacterized protein LOC129752065 [Uranotaenia lowii]
MDENKTDNLQLLREFYKLGCKDESLCAAACRTYIHLQKERKMRDVEYHYHADLDIIYLRARKPPDPVECTDTYIPVVASGTDKNLPLAALELWQNELGRVVPNSEGENRGDDDDKPRRCIVLAFCDTSSNVLLYRMTQGTKSLVQKPLSKNKQRKMKEAEGCSWTNKKVE